MVDTEASFREKIKNSFLNVKNDISDLKSGFFKIESDLKSRDKDISDLKSQIEGISRSLSDLKEILTLNKNSSTGNKGASNNHQQSTINNHQQSTTNHQQSTEAKKAIETLERDLAISFKMLTDREFSVFMAISELSGQHGETTYTQVANILNLTETSIRGAVNRIISKNLPVNKERIFNGKTSLFLRKDFKELNLLNKLIRLRQHPTDQKTLF